MMTSFYHIRLPRMPMGASAYGTRDPLHDTANDTANDHHVGLPGNVVVGEWTGPRLDRSVGTRYAATVLRDGVLAAPRFAVAIGATGVAGTAMGNPGMSNRFAPYDVDGTATGVRSGVTPWPVRL